MATSINPNGPPIRAKLEILNAHIGAYAVDLWNDDDASGGPSRGDRFLRRARGYRDGPGFTELGSAHELQHKTVQFIWIVRKDDNDDAKSRVEIDLQQGGVSLAGFPKRLELEFREGQHHDVFQVWYHLA
jgi:hypothetical protein